MRTFWPFAVPANCRQPAPTNLRGTFARSPLVDAWSWAGYFDWTPSDQTVIREKSAVGKKELIRSIAESAGLTQLQTKKIVQGVFDVILQTLAEDGRIELRNFGVFEVRQRGPHKARNPKTGEAVFVPGKSRVIFKPGQRMQQRVEALED
jgi:nucleoid DNA-binding protein